MNCILSAFSMNKNLKKRFLWYNIHSESSGSSKVQQHCWQYSHSRFCLSYHQSRKGISLLRHSLQHSTGFLNYPYGRPLVIKPQPQKPETLPLNHYRVINDLLKSEKSFFLYYWFKVCFKDLIFLDCIYMNPFLFQ